MEPESNMLNMLAEKIVLSAINAEHLAYCPSMDLIALATVDEQVHVHRLNGQRVFGVANKKSGAKIQGVQWKPNGQILAVAYSNHTICLASAHTGKVMHQIDCLEHSASQICCLGWGINFTDAHAVRTELEKSGMEKDLDDVLGEGTQSSILDSLMDLPLDLAFLDIEATLPKLSTLAMGGTDDDVFASRASLDTIFQPLTKSSTDSADILVVGFEDGTVYLSISDFFEIGSFSLLQASRALKNSKPIMHCSHPYSTTHPLLVSASVNGAQELLVVPLDLRLISSAGRYLSLLASKSTQLHNILRYLHQVQRQMYSEFKISQDLPTRFIRNIEETLQEKCDCTWVQAAYHLVVTGNCYPPVKEWLVDEIGERGYKRWEKAAVTGYENVRRLAHENLIPALERFCVLLSRLRGLSRFQDSDATLGLSTQELDNILDTVNCVQLLAHHVLICAGSELRQFTAFSAWLRLEIELQSADASSTSANEAADKDFNIDHTSTLEYIQGAMMQSQLIGYFNMQSQGDQKPRRDLSAEGRSFFAVYKRELKDLSNHITPQKRIPGLEELISHLDTQCNRMFARIAETQKRNVRLGTPISLGADIPACMDLRMIIEQDTESNAEEYVLHVVLGPTHSQDGIRIFRIILNISNGMSSTHSLECAWVQMPMPIESVRDVKFVDDEALMVAVSNESSSRLLSIDYRKNTDASSGLEYTTQALEGKSVAESAKSVTASLNLQDTEQAAQHTRHTFPPGVSWAPEKMDINGRKGRRVICVVAQDKKRYRMYDVDSNPDVEEPEDGRDYGSDEEMLEGEP